jgi:acyl-ACP thioesterase
MRVDITRMPRYRETITVRTWHTGSVGFRAGREFLILCGDEQLAAASSRWLYYDLKRKRIAKIPGTVSEPYTTESDEAMAGTAIDFEVDKGFLPQKTVSLTTRDSDFDPNGHVNNAVYLDYLDTLIKLNGLASGNVCQVGIQYLKAIGRGIDTIQAGATRAGDRVEFLFFNPSAVYAAGFVSFFEAV